MMEGLGVLLKVLAAGIEDCEDDAAEPDGWRDLLSAEPDGWRGVDLLSSAGGQPSSAGG